MIVRTDLSAAQIAVQASHALLDATRQFLDPESPHPHFVLCAVRSAERLLAAADYLFCQSIRHTIFYEPDRNGEPTAIATEPLEADRRVLMARFRCLRRRDYVDAPEPAEEFGHQ